MAEPRRPIVVATGLPPDKAEHLALLAGQQLSIYSARSRLELATLISIAPPDLVLLDPNWNLPNEECYPSPRIDGLHLCAPPLLVWTDASALHALSFASRHAVRGLVISGVDDEPPALLTSLAAARRAVALQLLHCLDASFTKLPGAVATPLCALISAPDPVSASTAWSAMQRLPPTTLRRHLRTAGLAPPSVCRRIARLRFIYEHDRDESPTPLRLATLPGAPSDDSVRRDLHAAGFLSRRALAEATTGRFVEQAMRVLQPSRVVMTPLGGRIASAC